MASRLPTGSDDRTLPCLLPTAMRPGRAMAASRCNPDEGRARVERERGRPSQAKATRRRRSDAPTAPKPAIIIIQVAVSGTGAVASGVALKEVSVPWMA